MKTTVALLHNHYDAKHLEEVKSEMVKRGAPKVKAIWSEVYGVWLAVEGCHRLRAAHEMGITPEIVDISNRKSVTIQDDCENVRKSVKALAAELEDEAWRKTLLDW